MQNPAVNDRAVATASTTSCSLSSLPPELKNRIYEYVLKNKSRNIIIFTSAQDLYYDAKLHNLKQPALLQTSRQIRQESLGIFYRLHRFCFHLSWDYSTMPCDLGYVMNGTAMLRQFRISIPTIERFEVDFQIAANLKSWRIQLINIDRNTPRRAVPDDCDCIDTDAEFDPDISCDEYERTCEYCAVQQAFPTHHKRIRGMLMSSQTPLKVDVLCKIIEEVQHFGDVCWSYNHEEWIGHWDWRRPQPKGLVDDLSDW